jgi:HemY protein
MIAVLWFLFLASAIATSLVWVLDHNGFVIVTWLGYEAKTDILTAILVTALFTFFVFVFSYILARVLAIKFPNLLKLLFKKSYIKLLEKIIHRHHKAFEIMTKLSLALEVNDQKSVAELQKSFSKLVKNPDLNNFFLGKISFEDKDFSRAAELFLKFGDNKHAKILVLKSRLEMALQNAEDVAAIAYAKQILSVKPDSFDVAKALFVLYKKSALWQEAKALILQYGSDNFKDELKQRDVAVINAALAIEAYQQKKFLLAIKHAKISLRAENNFLPALEVMLKSWIKLGFSFKVIWKIKSLWRDNPSLILAEIFDLANRKSSPQQRIKAMKKLSEINNESALGKLAIGIIAFRTKQYEIAKEFLNLSISQEKSNRAYRIIANVEKALGNLDDYKKNIAKSKMFERDDHYTCNSCVNVTTKWSAKCESCGSYDSLEWTI